MDKSAGNREKDSCETKRSEIGSSSSGSSTTNETMRKRPREGDAEIVVGGRDEGATASSQLLESTTGTRSTASVTSSRSRLRDTEGGTSAEEDALFAVGSNLSGRALREFLKREFMDVADDMLLNVQAMSAATKSGS